MSFTASWIARARSAGSNPSVALARAAAPLMSAIAVMKSRGSGPPPMPAKFRRARSVCAPHSAPPGTSISPKLSCSLRPGLFSPWDIMPASVYRSFRGMSFMDPAALFALSPVDGRYRKGADPLRAVLSESGLIRERVRIEAAWLLSLAESVPQLLAQPLSESVKQVATTLALEPGTDAAAAVKAIEARINHDVKAVEYFVREKLAASGATPAVLELVHFGCTSEDINNLAYARMLRAARTVLSGELEKLVEKLRGFAHEYAALPMLSRTHGQTASPTTLGKEFANVVARLRRARKRFDSVEILGKWNGAVGNYNA